MLLSPARLPGSATLARPSEEKDHSTGSDATVGAKRLSRPHKTTGKRKRYRKERLTERTRKDNNPTETKSWFRRSEGLMKGTLMENLVNMEDLIERSEIVQLARRLRESAVREGSAGFQRAHFFAGKVAPLRDDQIARLRAQGCESSDWSQVLVAEGFDAAAVSHTRFEGRCVLGRFSASHELAPGVRLPSAIYNATLVSCEVGDDALIRDVGLLANYWIAPGAAIVSVGEMIASPNSTFGNGTEIALGVETGERAIRAFAELDLALAIRLVRAPARSDLRRAYEEVLRRYVGAIALPKGYVGPKATIRVCRRLSDVFVGENAEIVGATAVVNTTILSNANEPTRIGDGVLIRDSLIQWGCEVATGALVENSLLIEHSHAERHVKVSHSLLGPNTAVGSGEVTSAFLGPFVGFHHQSLIIATFWPEGKGNIGYGANVGSNHTGKAPDQELWPGEGMFFGLGVNIKFPSNFERAPYTIIATGVTTLPQKVEFPFSLINSSSRVFEGVSPAFNEIIPAWVVSDNAYMLARNETKFRERNHARRTPVATEVLRPDIVDLIKEARCRLAVAPRKAAARPGEPVLYFEEDIPGLGKNYLLETNRVKAIEAYSFCLRFYALRGLYRQLLELEAAGKIGEIEGVLSQPPATSRWGHELLTLTEELFDGGRMQRSVRELLALWVEHYRRYGEAVRTSKARDDERGARIIPDYSAIHKSADEDKVIRQLAAEHAEIEKRVETWLKH